MLDLAYSRHRMVKRHLRGRGLEDAHLLAAMEDVPREAFVEPGFEEFAYEDSPLAIGEGQTISQPYIVGLMIEKAKLAPGDTALEVGTGSGYAAAVMSRIADRVYTIERHATLADQAKRRFKRLGYENIVVRTGDGSGGWREAAPFDAVIVAAAGPTVPPSLKEQLNLGGRLIIPIGPQDDQRLIRITRTGANAFEEEDLGGVRFVPLIGEEGWGGPDHASKRRKSTLVEKIADAAEPLPDLDDPAFGAHFDRFGDRRVVLLGEATHGTSQFYRARAAITRRLIENHGFNIVAVEADWPDAATIDRYVRLRESKKTEAPFQRFPTWMWRNREVSDFIGWMREHNQSQPIASRRIGFHGLDIYNMSGSIAAVIAYLDEVDSEAAKVARERYACLTPWQNEPSTYGRAVLTEGYRKCEQAVIAQCRDLLHSRLDQSVADGDDLLDATQNARLIASAERYYRIMYYGGSDAWNLRDTHMFETLDHLLQARGSNAKAVVWAHNSHIGDARHTDMGTAREEVNIGQLCRERFADKAVLIGFGTHEGEVAAATDWDGDMEIKTIRPSLSDSYEHLFHEAGGDRFVLDMSRQEAVRRPLLEPRLERFIGVIYRPETERLSHYMYASLPRQFDAFVWFDRTTPVTPLAPEHLRSGVPETFPFGV